MRVSKAVRELSLVALSEAFKPGQTVYTILRHRSASGMSRSISVITINREGDIRQWDHHVSMVTGWGIDEKHEGVKVSGAGMDMGFHIVYTLGRILFPEGFAVEGRGRNGDPSGWDKDGGYALKQRWL